MKHYALIFYSTRTLTPEEQKQRPVDIASWVKQVMDMGSHSIRVILERWKQTFPHQQVCLAPVMGQVTS
jgi:hypothetical protein